MFFGGSLIVENNEYTRCTIESVDLTGGINNSLTVNSNLSTYVGKSVTIHYSGLNVIKNTGFIGVNTTTPGSALGVNGSMSLPIKHITADITLDCTNYTVLCDTNINTNITVKLPFNNNSISGRIYILKNIGSNNNNFLLNPQGSNINTNSSIMAISSFTTIRLQSDGTDWWII